MDSESEMGRCPQGKKDFAKNERCKPASYENVSTLYNFLSAQTLYRFRNVRTVLAWPGGVLRKGGGRPGGVNWHANCY
jgi:hypothetical protein